jgi:uncharacterized protein YdhG (YjbR/CyaY superfamily)
MKIPAATVPAYIAASPVERRACLNQLRSICRRVFEGATESIDYGMPCYKKDDTILAAFASQKNYIAIYPGPKALRIHRAKLKGASLGKGCIRYASPAKIDFTVIESVLQAAEGC